MTMSGIGRVPLRSLAQAGGSLAGIALNGANAASSAAVAGAAKLVIALKSGESAKDAALGVILESVFGGVLGYATDRIQSAWTAKKDSQNELLSQIRSKYDSYIRPNASNLMLNPGDQARLLAICNNENIPIDIQAQFVNEVYDLIQTNLMFKDAPEYQQLKDSCKAWLGLIELSKADPKGDFSAYKVETGSKDDVVILTPKKTNRAATATSMNVSRKRKVAVKLTVKESSKGGKAMRSN